MAKWLHEQNRAPQCDLLGLRPSRLETGRVWLGRANGQKVLLETDKVNLLIYLPSFTAWPSPLDLFPMTESIYIFRPEHYSEEDLFEIIRNHEQLRKNGCIGKCLMREIAQKQRNGFGGFSALDMTKIASEAAFEIIRRYFHERLLIEAHAVEALPSVESLILQMPAKWRMRWCEAEACACMGCANRSGRLQQLGYTKESWLAWKASQLNADQSL